MKKIIKQRNLLFSYNFNKLLFDNACFIIYNEIVVIIMEYLKEVTIKDIETLIELNIKTWKETYKNILPVSFLESLHKNKKELIKEEEERFIDDKLDGTRKYLFILDEESVGYLIISRCDIEEYNGLGEINALYLTKKVQNKGYGKKILEKALKELKSMGFMEVIIGCINESSSNKFFLSHGAKYLCQRKRYIMDLEVSENIYLYEL